jgi:hypothetical protein
MSNESHEKDYFTPHFTPELNLLGSYGEGQNHKFTITIHNNLCLELQYFPHTLYILLIGPTL